MSSFPTSREISRVHQPRYDSVKIGALLTGAARLSAELLAACKADTVLVHRKLQPSGIDWFERRLRSMGRPGISGVDDAIFLPQLHSHRFLRRLHNPDTICRLASMSSMIMTSTDDLAKWFSRYNPSTTVVPTVVDTDQFRPRSRPDSERRLTVGCFGSHSTSHYLTHLWPVLRRLLFESEFEIMVVGAGFLEGEQGISITRLEWQLDRDLEEFQSIEIGVYPLPDNASAAGKGGFKTIQYIAVGIQVVASPVGINRKIIKHGHNGFLADTEQEWFEALSALLSDTDLRRRIGHTGRRTAVERYSTAVHARASRLRSRLSWKGRSLRRRTVRRRMHSR